MGLQKDTDPLIRATAAAELGEMKSRQSFPALKAALDDPSGEVGFAAAKALWDMGDKTGRAFIEDVVAGQQKATDGGVKGALRRADRLRYDPKKMAVIGAKSASGALLGPFNIGVLAAEQVFKGGAEAARMQALNLLAEDCDAQTFKLLEVASTDDKTWAEKAAAAKALGTMRQPRCNSETGAEPGEFECGGEVYVRCRYYSAQPGDISFPWPLNKSGGFPRSIASFNRIAPSQRAGLAPLQLLINIEEVFDRAAQMREDLVQRMDLLVHTDRG